MRDGPWPIRRQESLHHVGQAFQPATGTYGMLILSLSLPPLPEDFERGGNYFQREEYDPNAATRPFYLSRRRRAARNPKPTSPMSPMAAGSGMTESCRLSVR